MERVRSKTPRMSLNQKKEKRRKVLMSARREGDDLKFKVEKGSKQ